jgi:hypothetical protein
MQTYNCTVAIAGDAGMSVAKERVTVPELMVLRAVHGEDAVRNLEYAGEADTTSPEERSRLAALYRKPPNVVRDTLGATGTLPKTLDESGIGDEFVLSAPAKKGVRTKASATKELEVPVTE